MSCNAASPHNVLWLGGLITGTASTGVWRGVGCMVTSPKNDVPSAAGARPVRALAGEYLQLPSFYPSPLLTSLSDTFALADVHSMHFCLTRICAISIPTLLKNAPGMRRRLPSKSEPCRTGVFFRHGGTLARPYRQSALVRKPEMNPNYSQTQNAAIITQAKEECWQTRSVLGVYGSGATEKRRGLRSTGVNWQGIPADGPCTRARVWLCPIERETKRLIITVQPAEQPGLLSSGEIHLTPGLERNN
ncbi:hypothetical protein SKAU_G00098300 [Synaphobranchus kaupii]|uniref:Uncharacterized protein n=1 Tax=Synaphobranchus kaupii TaxID=118154 RepID=A0A9Q1FYL7_SYNKA|nr:hypothetical protein SKAU_G00098300 [Synaphobranchus kaupii]